MRLWSRFVSASAVFTHFLAPCEQNAIPSGACCNVRWKGGQKIVPQVCWTPLHAGRPPAVGITKCPSCYCRGWWAPGWWPCAFSTVSWFSRRLSLGPVVCCTRRRPRYPSSPSSSRSLSRASSWPWPFPPRVSSAIWSSCSETRPVEGGRQMLNRSRDEQVSSDVSPKNGIVLKNSQSWPK